MCLLLCGCETTRYLAQAARGQAALVLNTRPIESVLKDPGTDEKTRSLLSEVAGIKSFGQSRGLKPTQSYTQYVDVKRPAVCWVVSASPPLKLEAYVWSFPLVGSFPYLGWFSPEDAREHAERLRGDGMDVDVRPVSAYSTLGFLKDAVLSTMLVGGRDAAGDLANVILHESLHATLYVSGQGTFNESLASFVADDLTPQWLSERYRDDGNLMRAWLDGEAQGKQRVARLHQVSQALEKLYASTLPDAVKLQQKWQLIAAVREELGIQRRINNATLMQFRTYQSGQDGFAALLNACGGDHARMLAALKRSSSSLFSHPQQSDFQDALAALVKRGC